MPTPGKTAGSVCKLTALPAGTVEGCRCDACLWVAALESEFTEREEAETDGQAAE